MHFGFLGAGSIAQALAGHLTRAGHGVMLSNRRGPDVLREQLTALGPHASAGTPAEAAAADMVFLATMWSDIGAALTGLPDWNRRILIDTTNQFAPVAGGGFRPVDTQAEYGIPTGSEVVASKAPGARVIKAFNTLYAPDLARDPRHDDGRRVLVYAGDDPGAKTDFAQLLDDLGFAPVDLGSLRNGGRLMQVGGPLLGQHLLTQHAEPAAPRGDH